MRIDTAIKRIVGVLFILSLCVCGVGFVVECGRGSTPPDSVGSVRLNVETYLAGKNQVTHPSIVAFEEKWNGYLYWMAYSPYPYANGEEENPCIAVSNDLLYWETPKGLVNPIANNEETGCDELKDPHILYREDLDQLEVWYLGRQAVSLGGDGTSLLVMRKVSDDGINWGPLEIMTQTEYLSPSVLWDGEKYQMWSIGYDMWGTTGTFVHQESEDGIHWSRPVQCSIGTEYFELDIWHGAVSMHLGEYYFAFIDNAKQKIYYCSSKDGIRFSEKEVIVDNGDYWDYLYRPVLLFDDAKITCFYGVIDEENHWYLSSSSGTQIEKLQGLRGQDTSKMYPLQDIVTDTHSIGYHLHTLLRTTRSYIRIELFVLVFIELGILLLYRKGRFSTTYFWVCVAGNVIVISGYMLYRFFPTNTISRIAIWGAIVFLNIEIDASLFWGQSLLKTTSKTGIKESCKIN